MKSLEGCRVLQILALSFVGILLGTAFVQQAFAAECSDEQYEQCNAPRCGSCNSTSDCIEFCTDRCDDEDGNITCIISTCGDAGMCKTDAPCDDFCSQEANCGKSCTDTNGFTQPCPECSGGGEGGGGHLPAYGELLSRDRYTWVWQSSTAWGGDARRAVDGNPDGNWVSGSVTHTDINVRPEWHIYTKRTLYKSMTIYNRTDCCGERLGGASVWVGHWDAKSETYIWRRVATIGKKGKNPGREIHISFYGKLPNHNADALKITLPEGSKVPLSLAEVDLWGCGGPGQTCVE